MKRKISIMYGVVALIVYITGLSQGARNYLEHNIGLRAESFHPVKVLGISDDVVAVEGEMVTTNRNGARLAAKDVVMMFPLDFERNEFSKRIIQVGEIPSTTAITEIETESGTEFREAVKLQEAGVYFTNASYARGTYVADTRDPAATRIISASYSTGFSRDKSTDKWMPILSIIAHLLDFVTAPIQMIIVLLALLSPMSHWNS